MSKEIKARLTHLLDVETGSDINQNAVRLRQCAAYVKRVGQGDQNGLLFYFTLGVSS